MALNMSRADVSPGATRDANAGLRALIVDRDSMSSQLLADALVRNRSYQAAAVLSPDLLKTLAVREAHLVVIAADLRSGSGSGFGIADMVSRNYPQTGIMILLDQVSRANVISAFRSGARGVFSRQQGMTAFLECIDHVQRGHIWAGSKESTILLEALKSIPAPVISAAGSGNLLTSRELQVVQKAAQGKTNRAISQELNLSEHTVKNYLFRVFEKLGVSSRIELLFYLTMRGHNFGKAEAGAASGDGQIAQGVAARPVLPAAALSESH